MKCSGGCGQEITNIQSRTWRNGKKYCLNCYEEIIAMASEQKNKRD